jgi:hypothetical protein
MLASQANAIMRTAALPELNKAVLLRSHPEIEIATNAPATRNAPYPIITFEDFSIVPSIVLKVLVADGR